MMFETQYMKFVTYCMTFVVYDVCHIMTYIAYDVCRIMTLVGYDVIKVFKNAYFY